MLITCTGGVGQSIPALIACSSQLDARSVHVLTQTSVPSPSSVSQHG